MWKVPSGTTEDSPAIHRWDNGQQIRPSPGGAKETARHANLIFRPSRDLFPSRPGTPPINRWAIVFRPDGLRNPALHQRLVHGQQDEPFLLASEPRHRGFIRQVALQDPLLHQATALVLIHLQGPDHGLRA